MSGIYEKAVEGFLTRKIDWEGDEIRAVLVTKGYRPDFVKHQFLTDIAKEARVAMTPALQNKKANGFVVKADNVLVEHLTGPQCEAVVLFKQTDKESSSRLIAYIDEAEFLPHMPNGGDLDIMWNKLGIFALGGSHG